jgi:hypothetical protein
MLTEKEALTFMQKVDNTAPFWEQLHSMDDMQVKHAVYNLIVTRRDVNLYLKDIKPHAQWKISDVKAYFGIKGGKQKIADQINLLHREFVEPNLNKDSDSSNKSAQVIVGNDDE